MDKEPLYGQIGEIGLIPVHKRVSTGQNLSQRGQSLLWQKAKIRQMVGILHEESVGDWKLSPKKAPSCCLGMRVLLVHFPHFLLSVFISSEVRKQAFYSARAWYAR